MFNNSTYTNFEAAYPHDGAMMVPCARELFESQIPVTTGGFELGISCIRRS